VKHKINRRDFFKILGLSTTGKTFLEEVRAAPAIVTPPENKPAFVLGPVKLNKATEYITICDDCACGCKLIVYSEGSRVIQVERFADSQDNELLCCRNKDMNKIDNNN